MKRTGKNCTGQCAEGKISLPRMRTYIVGGIKLPSDFRNQYFMPCYLKRLDRAFIKFTGLCRRNESPNCHFKYTPLIQDYNKASVGLEGKPGRYDFIAVDIYYNEILHDGMELEYI